MFLKRRPTNSGASGGSSIPSRCEWIQCPACDRLVDGPVVSSKEAEDSRWNKDTPRYCKRILRLVPSPQVRPWWSERARQTL